MIKRKYFYLYFIRSIIILKNKELFKQSIILTEFKKGWWKISEEEHVRTVHRNLHPRGIREKSLQKSLQKCLEHACSSCNQENSECKELR